MLPVGREWIVPSEIGEEIGRWYMKLLPYSALLGDIHTGIGSSYWSRYLPVAIKCEHSSDSKSSSPRYSKHVSATVNMWSVNRWTTYFSFPCHPRVSSSSSSSHRLVVVSFWWDVGLFGSRPRHLCKTPLSLGSARLSKVCLQFFYCMFTVLSWG